MATELHSGDNTPEWGVLILEVQTDPAGPSSAALGQLFDCLYPYILQIAKGWLKQRQLSEATDGDLACIGWDKICNELSKFEPPDDSSLGIGRAFKAWVAKSCKREWSRIAKENLEQATDPDALVEFFADTSPSPEELLISSEGLIDHPARSSKERQYGSLILEQELAKLPESMRNALLESEDGKSVLNPNARGKAGESASIAAKYGHTQNSVRTRRSRLVDTVKERFDKEISHE